MMQLVKSDLDCTHKCLISLACVCSGKEQKGRLELRVCYNTGTRCKATGSDSCDELPVILLDFYTPKP